MKKLCLHLVMSLNPTDFEDELDSIKHMIKKDIDSCLKTWGDLDEMPNMGYSDALIEYYYEELDEPRIYNVINNKVEKILIEREYLGEPDDCPE